MRLTNNAVDKFSIKIAGKQVVWLESYPDGNTGKLMNLSITTQCGDGAVTSPEVCDPPGSVASCLANGQVGSKTCNATCAGYGLCAIPISP